MNRSNNIINIGLAAFVQEFMKAYYLLDTVVV